MSLNVTYWASASMAAVLAGVAFKRDSRTLSGVSFAAGLTLLAVRSALLGFGDSAPVDSIILWKRLSLIPDTLLPGCWLLFSLTFARANPAENARRWKLAIVAAFSVPVVLALVFGNSLFSPATGFVLRLEWPGKLYQLAALAAAVAILANLESTLRGARGSKRWRIKFTLIGVGCLFAVEVYLASQALLYSSVDLLLDPLRSYALLVSGVLFAVGLVRTWDTRVEIQVSRALLYNSLSVILIGAYLIAVGVIAETITIFGGVENLPIVTLVVFLLLLALALIALSDQLRERVRSFITHNLYAPGYDYRKEWTTFARRSTSIVDAQELCTTVARLVSETFGVDSVSLWQRDQTQGTAVFGGSTVLSPIQLSEAPELSAQANDLISHLVTRAEVVDFHDPSDGDSHLITERCSELLERGRIRLGVPLIAARRVVGIMTIGDRITKDPFGMEDLDLLRTMADQTAASLLNLDLSEQIARAKEMEAFQTLSTFFVHDLKNLASTLSLTIQNLPQNYDNPEFREDALRVISESVKKMNAMCSRLSLLNRKLELDCESIDLNKVVQITLRQVGESLPHNIRTTFRTLPPISIDAEQIGKVLTNLLLNAHEAIETNGEISVETIERDGWAICTVSDTGHGMSAAFIENSLFRPFKTTKAKGLGIGLFQSKQLIEAHGGRIEVTSIEGIGSQFSILLPLSTLGS